MQSVESYIRTQATVAAALNMVLNPFFTWLGNQGRAPTATGGVAVGMVITCLVMSVLIAAFVGPATRRAVASGRLEVDDAAARGRLDRLPGSSLVLGLLLGVVSAVVLAPLFTAVTAVAGVHELSFPALTVYQAVWTPALAWLVTTLVIRRQLLVPHRSPAASAR